MSAGTQTDGGLLLDSAYSWLRLSMSLLIGTIGSVGMWSVVVALPEVQADFGVSRADASLPFTMTMFGFAFGNVAMGRLSDRFGIVAPIILGAFMLCGGYLAAANAPSLWVFAGAYALIGLGSSASFGPMMADVSHWFLRHRGIAVAVAASGNYFAGAIWPPIVQHSISSIGWRTTHLWIGLFCVAMLVPLAFALRRRQRVSETLSHAVATGTQKALGISPNTLQWLLWIAGFACCVAMSMPQVHIVAYCVDLGFGPARGAEMLSLMLAFGIFSRIGSGFLADRIGGLATLLIGSAAQGTALSFYLFFESLPSLYVISAMFGLFQGGIVPSYAIVVREYFSPREAGTRVGVVIMATVLGMAFGGWVTGWIFDLTGSYFIAFIHGVAWNVLNCTIAVWLLLRSRSRAPRMVTA
jgi:MFS family permease